MTKIRRPVSYVLHSVALVAHLLGGYSSIWVSRVEGNRKTMRASDAQPYAPDESRPRRSDEDDTAGRSTCAKESFGGHCCCGRMKAGSYRGEIREIAREEASNDGFVPLAAAFTRVHAPPRYTSKSNPAAIQALCDLAAAARARKLVHQDAANRRVASFVNCNTHTSASHRNSIEKRATDQLDWDRTSEALGSNPRRPTNVHRVSTGPSRFNGIDSSASCG